MGSTGANTRTMNGWSALAAGLSLVLCSSPAASPAAWAGPTRAPGDGPYRVQMVSRTGKSLAPFTLSIKASTDNDYGVWMLVDLRRDGKRWKQGPDTQYAGIVGSAGPTVYDGGSASTSACPDGPACRYPIAFDGSRQITVTPGATTRYYVASAYADVTITVSTKGWRVQDVSNPGVRRVMAENANATGARAFGVGVEHFTSASAAGGRYGSSTFAAVACEQRGTGSARLTARGAVETGDVTCSPTTKAGGWRYAYSPVQTTWHLDGDVIGVGGALDRLFVFDYPKP